MEQFDDILAGGGLGDYLGAALVAIYKANHEAIGRAADALAMALGRGALYAVSELNLSEAGAQRVADAFARAADALGDALVAIADDKLGV